MAHGGKRENAGRKPKADELKVVESFRAVLSDDTVISKLAVLVEKGDIRAIEVWLSYVYGKPKQQTDITSNGETISINPIKLVD
jgi:hypothetical protein